jgi:hypothetical protein
MEKGMVKMVECLHSKLKALSSNPSTAKKKKRLMERYPSPLARMNQRFLERLSS